MTAGWQILNLGSGYVLAGKGKILNDLDMGDGWHVFETGSGSVAVQYKAPQVCEDKQEEIQVWNSCNCTGDLDNTIPEKEIGRVHFIIYDRKPETLTVHPEPIKAKGGVLTSGKNDWF